MKFSFLLPYIVFIFSPLFGVFSSFFLNILFKENKMNQIQFVFLFSLFLGIINSLKVVESDLLNYEVWFNDVKYFDFLNYLSYLNKEPLFFFYNYILYYLSFGIFKVYLIYHSFICYFLLGYSVIKMHSKVKYSNLSLILSLSVLFLFPNIFSLSAHLNRQFLAGSILMLFFVNFVFFSKNKFYLLFISIFIHTTSLIFILLYFLKSSNSKYNRIYFVFPLLILFYFVSNFSLFNESINYALNRIENSSNSNLNLGYFEFFNYFLFLLICFSFYLFYRVSNLGKVPYLFSLLFLIFLIFNSNNSEISLRFSFYFYFLFPFSFYFLYYLILQKFNYNHKFFIFMGLTSLFVFWFLYKLFFGTWQYIDLKKVILLSYW
ncbi:EpsG family protein [Algoriphagus formosus]|uniref:EpsG family protein n=1 Tax=Algoriphagus formosus TaxID=2007308 RepID=A0A4R5USP1_9BACT|nr:EpsG family protein [Algoriphagus aquimaris]TDK42041.1 EpsG family protein [Algoriphagus aquimaris]